MSDENTGSAPESQVSVPVASAPRHLPQSRRRRPGRDFLVSFVIKLLPETVTATAVAVTDLCILLVLWCGLSIPEAVEIGFKVLVVLVGALWALNRHFTRRSDEPQVRVEAVVSRVPSTCLKQGASGYGLLLVRMDLVNTGSVLVSSYRQHFEIWEVSVDDNRNPNYTRLSRWPSEGNAEGHSIEPGSWAALNLEVPVKDSVSVVRIHVELRYPDGTGLVWHRTYAICSLEVDGGRVLSPPA